MSDTALCGEKSQRAVLAAKYIENIRETSAALNVSR